MQAFQYTRFKNNKETLLDFLCRRFKYYNSNEWINNIIEGKVRLNGFSVSPYRVLSSQDEITYDRPIEEEPIVDPAYDVLYEDEYIIAVSKSGNIPVCESGRYVLNTLLHVVKAKHGLSELYAVQRLDKETSGVLVYAKQKSIAINMGKIISGYEHNKKYHAVLYGKMKDEEIIVDANIGKAGDSSIIRIRQAVRDEGKEAKTRFRRLFSDGNFTLAEIVTYTGRTHQIRCHAEHLGHPIVGDKMYGKSDDHFLRLLKQKEIYTTELTGQIDRQLLHSSWLEIPHPFSGERVDFSADYNPHFSIFPKIAEFLSKYKVST